MAVTKIKPIKTTLKKAIDYIMEPSKTDGKLLLSSQNCATETAYLEFKMTQKTCEADIGRAGIEKKNLAFHVIQAFDKKDDISTELAHDIGNKLILELTKNKFEYVLATHIDKGHIHNHAIFNAYSFVTHRKFVCHNKVFEEIREISDRLCLENNLNIIENPKEKGKSYKEFLEDSKGTSWKTFIRNTIDDISNNVSNVEDLINEMISLGFEIKYNGEDFLFKAPNEERFCKGKTLGLHYSKESIEERFNKK